MISISDSLALVAAGATAGLVGTAGGITSVVSYPALLAVGLPAHLANVANNIAKNINVDVSQIPVTVQAPIGVAATVCGVAANVLGQQAPTGIAHGAGPQEQAVAAGCRCPLAALIS